MDPLIIFGPSRAGMNSPGVGHIFSEFPHPRERNFSECPTPRQISCLQLSFLSFSHVFYDYFPVSINRGSNKKVGGGEGRGVDFFPKTREGVKYSLKGCPHPRDFGQNFLPRPLVLMFLGIMWLE